MAPLLPAVRSHSRQALRISHSFDEALRAGENSEEEALRRSATAVAKYWVCKRAPPVVCVAPRPCRGRTAPCLSLTHHVHAIPATVCRLLLPRCEAMECHGGNGFAEDWGMARLYRQAPLNSIWEGSGNVICLDVLRAMAREPESIAAFMAEVSACGACACSCG